jgi:hypothetical protein
MAHEMDASNQMLRILRDHGGALPMIDLLRLTDLSPAFLGAISEQSEEESREEATDEADLGIVFEAGVFRGLLARVSIEQGTAENLAAALNALDAAKPASAPWPGVFPPWWTPEAQACLTARILTTTSLVVLTSWDGMRFK